MEPGCRQKTRSEPELNPTGGRSPMTVALRSKLPSCGLVRPLGFGLGSTSPRRWRGAVARTIHRWSSLSWPAPARGQRCPSLRRASLRSRPTIVSSVVRAALHRRTSPCPRAWVRPPRSRSSPRLDPQPLGPTRTTFAVRATPLGRRCRPDSLAQARALRPVSPRWRASAQCSPARQQPSAAPCLASKLNRRLGTNVRHR